MDIIGASRSAIQLVDNIEIGDSLPFITSKASWNTQITGAYNLLYPLIHEDFPNRVEIMQYISQKITSAFLLHNATHLHNGIACQSIPDLPDQLTMTPIIKDEKMISKYGEEISVKMDPRYEVIGYGV